MSDYDDYGNYSGDDGDDAGQGPGPLRDAYKTLKKQLEEVQGELKTEREARQKAEEKSKADSLRSILQDQGVNPKLARWLEKDGIGPDEAKVKEWLEENGEFFNVKPQAPASSDDDSDGDGEDPGDDGQIDTELEQQIRNGQQAGASAQRTGGQDIESKLTAIDPSKFKTAEDLQKAMQEALGMG